MIEKNDISFISCHFVRLLLFRKQQNDAFFLLSPISCTAFSTEKGRLTLLPFKGSCITPHCDNIQCLFTFFLTAEILLLVSVIYRLKTKRRNAFTSTHTNRMPLLQNFLSFWHAGNMLQIEEEFSISEQIFSLIPPKIFNRIATQF